MRAGLATVTVAVILLNVAACGEAGEEASATAAAPSTSVSSPAAGLTDPPPASEPESTIVTIEVAIVGGRVEPPPTRVDVRQGQTVRITVTSDEPDEVHVHGYDAEIELTPGQPGTTDLVADQAGLFEVETHEQELQLFQLVVQ